MAPLATWLPSAIMAGASIGGSALAKRGSGQSAEEKGYVNSLTANAEQAGQQGKALYDFGLPLLQRSSSYYGALMGGDRAKQAQILQPEISGITDLYRGAEKNMERAGVRGGVRDTAIADLSRQRSGQIAGLVPGLRPAAASALTGLGQTGVAGGQAGSQVSSSVYGGLLGNAQQNRQFGTQQTYQYGQDFGAMIGQLLSSSKGKSGKPQTSGL